MFLPRLILIIIGTAGTFLGLYILLTTVRPSGLLGLGIWLLGSLVLHDGLLSPFVWLGNRVLRGAGRRLPLYVLALIQVAVIIGVVMTGLVLPEIIEQRQVVNKTVVPLDYGLGLVGMWLSLAIITVGACCLPVILHRYRQRRATT